MTHATDRQPATVGDTFYAENGATVTVHNVSTDPAHPWVDVRRHLGTSIWWERMDLGIPANWRKRVAR